jgi:hypothetical protein
MLAIRQAWGEGAFSDDAWKLCHDYFDKNAADGGSKTPQLYQRHFSGYQQFLLAQPDGPSKFSAPSLVEAALWRQKRGDMTWSGFDSFFTAFNEIHRAYHAVGTILAELAPIKGARKSAKLKVIPRHLPSKAYYPDPAEIFASWGTEFRLWTLTLLRQRSIFSLHSDVCGRGGEASKVVVWQLLEPQDRDKTDDSYARRSCPSPLQEGQMHTMSHQGDDAPLRREGLRSSQGCGLQPTSHWRRPAVDDVRPLFGTPTHSGPGDYKSLGSQRVAKCVLQEFKDAKWDSSITAHKLRGVVSSKAVNMGHPVSAVLLRARISEETWRKRYFKYVLYKERSERNARLPIEHVIRIRATVLGENLGRVGVVRL